MKRIFSAVLAALLIFALAACGDSAAKAVDVQQLADALKAGITDETLTAVSSDELAFSLSAMPETYTAAAYRGTAAAEVIAVQCQSGDDAALVKASLESHLAELKDQASKYQPEQVPLLDSAILSAKGNCVVLCITSDTGAANATIKEYLG